MTTSGTTATDRVGLGTPGTGVRIEVGSAYELLASALPIADPEGAPRFADIELWRELAGPLPGPARETLVALGPHPIINLLGLALEMPEPRTAAGFLGHLASVPAIEVVRTAIGRYRRTVLRDTPAEIIDAAIDGSAEARDEFLARAWPEAETWQSGIRYLVSGPPTTVGPTIVDALRAWHAAAFVGQEARLVEAQAEQRQRLLEETRAWRLEPLLRRVVPTIDYIPAPGVERITFVPTLAIRPTIVVLDHRMEGLILFPVRPEQPDEAPPEELVLIGKALGDELRLRALRALASGPHTLGDLAAELGVPRTSLGHHIGVLRAAGLIGLTIDDGRYNRLTLRPEGLNRLTPMLRDFLGDRGPDR